MRNGFELLLSSVGGFGANEDLYIVEPNPVKRCLYDASGKARYYGQHAYREMRKRKFNYCLGVSSVFMVRSIAYHVAVASMNAFER